uniref:MOSC domain-containing protein n=1 Tax=Timema tahoe TaxID=61484 RepID=A0A7R9NYM4_9NEOP|nr:unnamed protein product [Timema tahoe]
MDKPTDERRWTVYSLTTPASCASRLTSGPALAIPFRVSRSVIWSVTFVSRYQPAHQASRGLIEVQESLISWEYELVVIEPGTNKGAYSDLASYMLMSESTVAELDSRLPESARGIGTLQFRPNLVVQGSLPYEEDTWDWIRVGDTAIFRNIKPCVSFDLQALYAETLDII